jgi:RND family efflux transporter MFP subunit
MKTPKSLTLSLLLFVAATLAVAGCADGQAADESGDEAATEAAAADEATTTRVEVLRLAPSAFEDVVELNGTVEAVSDATLSAQAAGTVERIAERGDRVAAGGVVAQLDADEARAARAQAQAQFDLAQDAFERQEPLVRDSIISALEFERVRAERNQARAALDQAEKRLANTRVTAPFAGTVEERLVEPGEQAAPGTPVARLVSTRRVKVVAGVPERYAADIAPGTSVRMSFRAYGGGEIVAPVTFVGTAIDPDTRTFPIEVELGNADRTLKPAMVARLFVTRARLDDALVLPRSALVRDETGTHVFVATEGNGLRAEKRAITLGPVYGPRAVVRDGLAEGDRVVVAGQNQLAPGDRIRLTATYTALDAAGTPYGPSDG